MALSESEKQVIFYTILGHIDSFHINVEEDFTNLIYALNSILTRTPPPYYLGEQHMSKMESIKDYISPDFMAVSRANYGEFLYLVQTILGERISRITRMSRDEKNAYIREQQQRRPAVAASQAFMDQHHSPTGMARTSPSSPNDSNPSFLSLYIDNM